MKSNRELITTLEDLLVKQFRNLQTLIMVTREERKALTNGDLQSIQKRVEEKEAILDEMSLLEENRKMTITSLCLQAGLTEERSSLSELTKTMDPVLAQRIDHLHGGIIKLAEEVRDLNMGNHALANAKVELCSATQAFILSCFQSPVSYQPNNVPPINFLPITDHDHRA
jgi:flagellar biosynthesis/type III secretory pathway chaperone